MIRIICLICLFASLSLAQIINSIALSVNDEAITTFDIEQRTLKSKLSKKDAVNSLIDEILYRQELENKSIIVDIFDTNKYLKRLAKSNGMRLHEFQSIVRQKYKDYSIFEEEIKESILKEKLTYQLVRGNLQVASEEDMKIYFNSNKEKFTSTTSVEAKEFVSKNKQSLISLASNPMLQLKDVKIKDITLKQKELNAQVKYLVNNTNINQFTPIFVENKSYMMFYIVKKLGSQNLDFEEVKNKIFSIIMRDREVKYLKDYFEKLRLNANIKIVR